MTSSAPSDAPAAPPDRSLEELLASRVGAALAPAAGILAGLYAVYAEGYWLWGPEGEVRRWMVGSTGATALGFFLAWLWLRRRPNPALHAHGIAGAMALTIGANSWFGLIELERPYDTTNLMLFAIAVGSVLLSPAWFLGLAVANLVVWGVVAFQAAPDPQWGHYGFALVTATAIGGIVHAGRRTAYRREHRLRAEASASARALDANLRRTAALVSALPDAVVRIDRDGVCLDLMLPEGTDPELRVDAILGKPLDEVFPQAIAERAVAQVRETLASDRLTAGEYRMRFDGSPIDLELRAVPHGEDEVVGIVRDVTERKRLDALRDDFVATVSHELRTPLTSIHGTLRLIAGGVAGEVPGEVQDLVGIASENSERLRRLIDDLLDMRKMEVGELDLRPRSLDLPDALARSLAANEGYAESHGVRLELAEPVPPARVRVDADRLQQVMANLLSNAIKFSGEGDRVTVALAVRDGRAEASVIDRGPGIPPEFQERVFQRFAQADTGSARTSAGTGLGLAICKRLVEASGGRIGFETGAGKGTRFYFELPLEEAGLARDFPGAKG